MGQMMLPLMMASTVLSAGGQVQSGLQTNRAAQYEAGALRTAGGQALASSQRVAYGERRQKDLALSRAQAVAAASGGGATDKGVLDIMAGIEAQGEYNAMSALYEGQAAKQAYETQADLTSYAGKQARMAGFLKGTTTALAGGSSLYEKYGKPSKARVDEGPFSGHGYVGGFG